MELLRQLTSPYRFLAWSFLTLGVLVGALWLMWSLPGHSGSMCLMGGILQRESVVFAVLFAPLVAANLVFLPELFRNQNTPHRAVRGVWSGIPILGSILGVFTLFCTVCTLPVLLFFGASVSLSFFVTYSLWIQGLSIILLLVSLWFTNRVLTRTCATCVM